MISDVLPFGRLWYGKVDDAIGYAQHYSRSHNAVIRVQDFMRDHCALFKKLLMLL